MWKVLEIIWKALKANDVMVLIKEFLKALDYNVDGWLNLLDIVTDPVKLFKALMKAPQEHRKKLYDDIVSTYAESIKNTPTNHAIPAVNKDLLAILKKRHTQEGKEQLSAYQEAIKMKRSVDTWVPVNSSWILMGNWRQTNNRSQTGQLTIMIQQDKNPKIYGPYTYPSIPYEVWELMVQAKGDGAGGAGTIFWRYWLRQWIPSHVRKYIKEHLASEMGITHGPINRRFSINFKQLAEVRAFIFKKEKQWRSSAYSKRFGGILSQQWHNERSNTFKLQRSALKRQRMALQQQQAVYRRINKSIKFVVSGVKTKNPSKRLRKVGKWL